MIKQTLGSLVIALALAGPLAAQERPESVLRAAEAGDAQAQLEMGILYEFGFDMPDNQIPALAWYMLAARQGNEKAIKRRDLLMNRMPQPQIEQARRESESLLASQGVSR